MVTEKASQYCCFYQRDGRFLIVDDKRNSEVCGNNKKTKYYRRVRTRRKKGTGSIGGWLNVALYSVVQPDRPLRKKMKQKQTTQKETRS